MISRRRFSAALLLACLVASGPARAAGPVEVAVASNALAAIVAAEGGAAVVVVVDRSLAPAQLRIGADVTTLAGAPARRGHLDDPRNAPKLGASVRDALAAAHPELKAQLEANHKAWTPGFVRKVLAWNTRVAAAGLRGKRVVDPGDRGALLEWAGAVVDKAGQRPPAALERAPRDAAAPTLESYVAYVDSLVASLS